MLSKTIQKDTPEYKPRKQSCDIAQEEVEKLAMQRYIGIEDCPIQDNTMQWILKW